MVKCSCTPLPLRLNFAFSFGTRLARLVLCVRLRGFGAALLLFDAMLLTLGLRNRSDGRDNLENNGVTHGSTPSALD